MPNGRIPRIFALTAILCFLPAAAGPAEPLITNIVAAEAISS